MLSLPCGNCEGGIHGQLHMKVGSDLGLSELSMSGTRGCIKLLLSKEIWVTADS